MIAIFHSEGAGRTNMKCPKCQWEETTETIGTSYFHYTQPTKYRQCKNCGIIFTDWQQKKIDRLREGLRTFEWTPCDDYCENEAHDLAGPNSEDDDMHHRSCMACGAMQCEGHKPDCWINELLEGK